MIATIHDGGPTIHDRAAERPGFLTGLASGPASDLNFIFTAFFPTAAKGGRILEKAT